MKVGSFRRFSKEDFKELPDWAESFFQQLNTVLETHNNALNKGLTFNDNQRAEVRTLTIPHDTTFAIELQQLKRNPIGVILLYSNFYEYSDLTWRFAAEKARTVEVKIKWATVPSEDPEVTLLFVG